MAEALFTLHQPWEICTLGDAAARGGGDVQTGPFGSQLHASDYVSVGIPSVMPQNIGDNTISVEGIARIRLEDAQRLSKYRLRVGDIVYSRRGDVERRALIRQENDGWLCGTGCLRVRFGEGHVVPEYAAFYLGHSSVRAWIVQHAVGATMPNLNTKILSALPFILPPKNVQQSIAETLGSLDDKIELNRRMNGTLEAMAQAIFRDWFVDFGPTRRKVGGATDPVEIMGGLVTDPGRARPLGDLFPSRFGDNGLPERWEERRLEDIATQHTSVLAPFAYPDETFAHHSIPAFDKDQNPSIDLGSAILSNKTIVPAKAVLLSKLNPDISRVWLPDDDFGYRAICSTEFLAYAARAPFGRTLLYSLFSSDPFRSMLVGMVTGTSKSHQRVSPKALTKRVVLVAGKGGAAAFEALAGALLERVQHNRAESRTLAATRDLLLPKLMSGEIRLRDAEAYLEAAQ